MTWTVHHIRKGIIDANRHRGHHEKIYSVFPCHFYDFVLSACGGKQEVPAATQANTTALSTEAAETAQEEASAESPKVLVAYFSATHTTQGVAEKLAGSGTWLDGHRVSGSDSQETILDWANGLGIF